MKIELREGFLQKLEDQVDFIAQDKPRATRKFKNDILKLCKKLSDHPCTSSKISDTTGLKLS